VRIEPLACGGLDEAGNVLNQRFFNVATTASLNKAAGVPVLSPLQDRT
jgi:hypothetical protein